VLCGAQTAMYVEPPVDAFGVVAAIQQKQVRVTLVDVQLRPRTVLSQCSVQPDRVIDRYATTGASMKDRRRHGPSVRPGRRRAPRQRRLWIASGLGASTSLGRQDVAADPQPPASRRSSACSDHPRPLAAAVRIPPARRLTPGAAARARARDPTTRTPRPRNTRVRRVTRRTAELPASPPGVQSPRAGRCSPLDAQPGRWELRSPIRPQSGHTR
jgi:hypothetical protein